MAKNDPDLGAIFLELAPELHVYQEYVDNYAVASTKVSMVSLNFLLNIYILLYQWGGEGLLLSRPDSVVFIYIYSLLYIS